MLVEPNPTVDGADDEPSLESRRDLVDLGICLLSLILERLVLLIDSGIHGKDDSLINHLKSRLKTGNSKTGLKDASSPTNRSRLRTTRQPCCARDRDLKSAGCRCRLKTACCFHSDKLLL